MNSPKPPIVLALLLLAVPLFLVGCGESHTNDDAGGTGTDSGIGTDSGTTRMDSGTGTDSGTTLVDSGTLPDSGALPDSAGTPDADMPPLPDAATPDVPPSPDGGPAVDCMGMACGATEQCCITGGPGGANAMCIPAGEMCEGATVDCDGPEDCGGGEVCCGQRDGTGLTVECVAADACPGGFRGFELCHETPDCTDSSAMCCPFNGGGFMGSICAPRCF